MNGMGHSLNVNDGDHANYDTTVNDWESIDEDDDDEEYSEDEDDDDEDVDESEYDNLSKADLQKILLSVKGENKGLKKKLKDIELGHESSSIIANDGKYIKLEEEFSDLATRYMNIESEVEHMTIENESHLKDIAQLKEELQQSRRRHHEDAQERGEGPAGGADTVRKHGETAGQDLQPEAPRRKKNHYCVLVAEDTP
ncbi:hypothetical protein PMKS-000689 [Pichia membranifaciens]|uniref:Uncharacterized protein n=1 Tax=Pichia membranifaciens TaxID=4926 RepID=A0A1Q2YCH1_9ASCO|nr:hypothetical protein PMKS-000689 [Pichia membranifaciens]